MPAPETDPEDGPPDYRRLILAALAAAAVVVFSVILHAAVIYLTFRNLS